MLPVSIFFFLLSAMESFMSYRSDPLKSPKFLSTDTSTMEESSSAEDEKPLRRGRRKSTRKSRKLLPPQRVGNVLIFYKLAQILIRIVALGT